MDPEQWYFRTTVDIIMPPQLAETLTEALSEETNEKDEKSEAEDTIDIGDGRRL